MKKLTRVMAIVLALLCALALVSCGGDSETTADVTTTVATTQKQDETVVTTTGNTTGTVSSVTNTTVSNKDTKEPTNKPGVAKIDDLITRTKNASGNATDAFVNSLKGYNLTIMYPWEQKKPGSTIGDSLEYCREEVEKEFGVTITEDGYFSGYNEALTASLTARNAKAQVYMLQNFNFVSYFSNGYITDLTAAMKTAGVDFNEPWYIQDAQAFLNIDYRQYGWIAFSGTYTFPDCIIYNQEYIKNARLTDPAELAEQGKWTWDTLISYSKKLTTSNVIGFGCLDKGSMLASMVAPKGVSVVNVTRGSKPTHNFNNQTIKDALATMQKWGNEKSVTLDFIAEGHDWTYGKTQLYKGNVAMCYGFHDTIQSLGSSDYTFGIAPFPTEKGSTTYTNVCIPQFINFIPSQYQKEADKILFLRNEIYRHNYRFAARDFDIEWGGYFSNDTDVIEDASNLKYAKNGNTSVFDWSSISHDNDANATHSSILSAVINNGQSVQTALDKYSKALDKNYEDTWGSHKITGKV